MNMLSNAALQQLDEAGLMSPAGVLRPNVSQEQIHEGLRRAHELRALAVQRALSRLVASLR